MASAAWAFRAFHTPVEEHRLTEETTGGHEGAERRRLAALAGHCGDEATARSLAVDGSAAVRATALGALSRMGRLDEATLAAGLADPDPAVRRRASEEARHLPGVDLVPLLSDPDPAVVEATAWALGERGEAAAAAVPALAAVATDHGDPSCREAAVAALGAIGHAGGLPAILTATADKPAVRRRAVLALAPFEGEAVDRALRKALADRDWQVRQAAEDLLGDEI